MSRDLDRRRLITALVIIGMGMGGFIDGIVLHQLLQVHSMVSAVHPPTTLVNADINKFWDGVFHLGTWSMTALGLGLLYRAVGRGAVRWPGRTFIGSLLLGWGLFNTVEGVLDHHVLHLHHVVERLGVSVWDWVFLASGAVLIAVGARLIRAGERALAGETRGAGHEGASGGRARTE